MHATQLARMDEHFRFVANQLDQMDQVLTNKKSVRISLNRESRDTHTKSIIYSCCWRCEKEYQNWNVRAFYIRVYHILRIMLIGKHKQMEAFRALGSKKDSLRHALIHVLIREQEDVR